MLVEFFTEDLDNEKFQHGLYLRGDDTLGKEKFSLATLCVIILFLNSIYYFYTWKKITMRIPLFRKGVELL